MRRYYFFIVIILGFGRPASAECIHETRLSGAEIKLQEGNVFIKNGAGYYPSRQFKLNNEQQYQVQIQHPLVMGKTVEYYTNDHLSRYLNELHPHITLARYHRIVIGSSLEGRPIEAIYPKEIDLTKKFVIMGGRQHGDESTANWIIEGFLNQVFTSENSSDWHDRFQLVAYPIINPDGAEHNTRYNANNRDLNRSWRAQPAQSRDEAQIIHQHLSSLGVPQENIVVFLDMHGSYWLLNNGDFIYHVDKDFRSESFYQIQMNFIDELSLYDPWNGRSKISNGHDGMIRIIMVRSGINGLTHETPRDIPWNNSEGRTTETLKSQGVALFDTIMTLY